jgi:hypothetical protein
MMICLTMVIGKIDEIVFDRMRLVTLVDGKIVLTQMVYMMMTLVFDKMKVSLCDRMMTVVLDKMKALILGVVS